MRLCEEGLTSDNIYRSSVLLLDGRELLRKRRKAWLTCMYVKSNRCYWTHNNGRHYSLPHSSQTNRSARPVSQPNPMTSIHISPADQVALVCDAWSCKLQAGLSLRWFLSERCKGISDLTFSFKPHNSTQTGNEHKHTNTITAASSIANLCNHVPPPNASTSCSMHA